MYIDVLERTPNGVCSPDERLLSGRTNRTRIHLLRAAESRECIYAVWNACAGLQRARSKFALSASRVSYPRSYLDITTRAVTYLRALPTV